MKILNDGSIPDGIEEGAEGEALKSSINNLIEDKVVEVAAPAGVPTQQPPINEEKVDDELNDEEAEEVWCPAEGGHDPWRGEADAALQSNEVYMPVTVEDETGRTEGNIW